MVEVMNVYEALGYLTRKADKSGLEALHAIKMDHLATLDALTNARDEVVRLQVRLSQAHK